MKLQITGMALAALLAAAPAAHADLIQNGGFETGDFTDWTLNNDANSYSFVYGSDPGTTYVPHSGNYEALLGAYGADGTLSQTVTDASGVLLQLTYWLASDGNSPNDFSAYWNGKLIQGSALTNIANSGYVEYTFDVYSTGSDTLTFDERDDYGFLSLDDVSLVYIPEPGTIALLGFGIGALVFLRRRKSATTV